MLLPPPTPAGDDGFARTPISSSATPSGWGAFFGGRRESRDGVGNKASVEVEKGDASSCPPEVVSPSEEETALPSPAALLSLQRHEKAEQKMLEAEVHSVESNDDKEEQEKEEGEVYRSAGREVQQGSPAVPLLLENGEPDVEEDGQRHGEVDAEKEGKGGVEVSAGQQVQVSADVPVLLKIKDTETEEEEQGEKGGEEEDKKITENGDVVESQSHEEAEEEVVEAPPQEEAEDELHEVDGASLQEAEQELQEVDLATDVVLQPARPGLLPPVLEDPAAEAAEGREVTAVEVTADELKSVDEETTEDGEVEVSADRAKDIDKVPAMTLSTGVTWSLAALGIGLAVAMLMRTTSVVNFY